MPLAKHRRSTPHNNNKRYKHLMAFMKAAKAAAPQGQVLGLWLSNGTGVKKAYFPG